MTKVTRDITITPSFKAQLKDRAWKDKLHLSQLVAAEVEQYADFVLDEVVVRESPTDRVRISIEPDKWELAQARAASEGVSLSEAIRKRLASDSVGGYDPATD